MALAVAAQAEEAEGAMEGGGGGLGNEQTLVQNIGVGLVCARWHISCSKAVEILTLLLAAEHCPSSKDFHAFPHARGKKLLNRNVHNVLNIRRLKWQRQLVPSDFLPAAHKRVLHS